MSNGVSGRELNDKLYLPQVNCDYLLPQQNLQIILLDQITPIWLAWGQLKIDRIPRLDSSALIWA